MSKLRFISRRDFLFEAGSGISGLALIDLLGRDGLLAQEPSRPASACASREGFPGSPNLPKPPHFKPRAKSVISLFMSGGVSHVDTFDYKPALEKYHGMPLEGKGDIRVRQGFPGPLMKSPYRFKQYGQSGAWVSELFPHIASIVDDLAFIHSCQGRSNDHVLAHYEWNTGSILMGFPSVGSWVTYGLGSENQNLPGFVVIYDARGGPFSGPANWSAGFLPAAYQGTVFRSTGDPILNQNVDTWDAHASIVDNHGLHAPEVDKPIAGLITDLKRRGLLDETLVMWHSEFGRMPISQRGLGRDHNPGAMTIFMAGAGIKGGQKIGASDEVGYKAEEQIVPCHDLHATILHLLGLDHKRVTYFFNGRHMRLTDVHGELIPQITG